MTEPANKSPGRDSPGRGRQRRRRLLLGGVAIGAALLIVGVVTVFFSPTPVEPPPASVEDLAPAVRDIVVVAQGAVRREPFSGEAWGQLGMVLFAHRLEHDARFCFRQASELQPDEVRWPYLLGVSLSVEDTAAARELFQSALSLQPDSAVIQCRLAELALGRNAVDEAEQLLRDATRSDAKNARAWLDLASVAYMKSNLPESRKLGEKALELAPGQRAPHAFLAMVLQALGERDEALRHLELAQQLPDHTLLWEDPIAAEVLQFRQDTDAILGQAEQLLESNQPSQAAGLLQQAIAAGSSDPRLPILSAKILMQTGQLDQAAIVVDGAARDFPHSASVTFQQGVIAFLQRRYLVASEHFRETIQRKPDHALAYYNLGHSLLNLDKPSEAAVAFRNAIRFQPGHADARINLARLLIQQDDSAAARRQLEAAVKLRPQDREARRLLRQLSDGGSP